MNYDNHPLNTEANVQKVLQENSTSECLQSLESSSIKTDSLQIMEELKPQLHCIFPDDIQVDSVGQENYLDIPDEIIRLIERSSYTGHEDNPGPLGRNGIDIGF